MRLWGNNLLLPSAGIIVAAMTAKVSSAAVLYGLGLLAIALVGAGFSSPTASDSHLLADASVTEITAGPELAPAPSFSRPGGFYTDSFDLELKVPGRETEIRFTLDGSEPTRVSAFYQKPLLIGSRAGTRNNISNIPTVPGGPMPAGEVFKGWVVRARTYQPGANPSAVVTATFWIDPRGRRRYSLPVVSLSTAPANFFSSQTGIYVSGRAMNYLKKGPEWSRPVHVELYETNNECSLCQEARAKIHGNTSQMWPLKGLDLQASGRFGCRLFPDRSRTQFKHFLLRPSGQDQQVAFMRDELAESLAAEAGVETQATRACIVFINGEYWGLNYLTEKEDVEFVAALGSLSKRQIDYLEVEGDSVKTRCGDPREYHALVDYVRRHDLQTPEAYAYVAKALDLTNYIDYKCSEIFAYRWDINQLRVWRPRTTEGRWRCLGFDYDVAWGGFWSQAPAWQFNMLAADLATDGSLHGHNIETTTLFLRRLMINAQFRRDFVNRFQDLLNTIFLPTHTLARIDQFISALAPEMEEHIRRWRAPASVTEWKHQVEELRSFGRQRPQYAREQLRQQFGLEPACRLSVRIAPINGGTVRLNTLWIDSGKTNTWSGFYFRHHPIPVEARPSPGFRFEGWIGCTNSLSNPLTLSPEGDSTLTARFERDTPVGPP